jgi:hypothetical protein
MNRHQLAKFALVWTLLLIGCERHMTSASLRYPNDSSVPASSFPRGRDACGQACAGLSLRLITLIPWSATLAYRKGAHLDNVDPNREVYEILATFNAGSRVLDVDAATGDVLWNIATVSETAGASGAIVGSFR